MYYSNRDSDWNDASEHRRLGRVSPLVAGMETGEGTHNAPIDKKIVENIKSADIQIYPERSGQI